MKYEVGFRLPLVSFIAWMVTIELRSPCLNSLLIDPFGWPTTLSIVSSSGVPVTALSTV